MKRIMIHTAESSNKNV